MKSFTHPKQLHAFTLLELLVGMILSGIVLTATFSAYHIITRQYEMYTVQSDSDAEVSFFVSQLQDDFANADTALRVSENEIQLRSKERMLEYGFSERRVLRNDLSRMDTFRVSITGIETYYKKEKTNSDAALFDELHVLMDVDGQKVEKIYWASIHFCHFEF
jgi:prepilin-type N-terminal cleavage/methylation domain-containing protein